MDALLEAKNVEGGYHPDESVISDVSLTIRRGDFLGIIGPNGCGKSTLLRLVTRVLAPSRGQITYFGEDIRRMKAKAFARRVAFVPQETPVNFSFSAWEIVLMGRIPHLGRLQFESKKDYAIAEKALKLTDALHLKDKEIDELSAGERQRVMIAKALTQEPTLLFLDEPTSHLDIGHQVMILDLLKKLNKQNNLTVAIVMHDLNLAGEYCNRLVLMNEGRIFREGACEKVLNYENIESVYKTVVVVKTNPISSKPYVILVPGADANG